MVGAEGFCGVASGGCEVVGGGVILVTGALSVSGSGRGLNGCKGVWDRVGGWLAHSSFGSLFCIQFSIPCAKGTRRFRASSTRASRFSIASST